MSDTKDRVLAAGRVLDFELGMLRDKLRVWCRLTDAAKAGKAWTPEHERALQMLENRN